MRAYNKKGKGTVEGGTPAHCGCGKFASSLSLAGHSCSSQLQEGSLTFNVWVWFGYFLVPRKHRGLINHSNFTLLFLGGKLEMSTGVTVPFRMIEPESAQNYSKLPDSVSRAPITSANGSRSLNDRWETCCAFFIWKSRKSASERAENTLLRRIARIDWRTASVFCFGKNISSCATQQKKKNVKFGRFKFGR